MAFCEGPTASASWQRALRLLGQMSLPIGQRRIQLIAASKLDQAALQQLLRSISSTCLPTAVNLCLGRFERIRPNEWRACS